MYVRTNLDGLYNNEDSLTLDTKFHLLACPCSIILQACNTILKRTTHTIHLTQNWFVSFGSLNVTYFFVNLHCTVKKTTVILQETTLIGPKFFAPTPFKYEFQFYISLDFPDHFSIIKGYHAS
jgi:hypothetical protein